MNSILAFACDKYKNTQSKKCTRKGIFYFYLEIDIFNKSNEYISIRSKMQYKYIRFFTKIINRENNF